jgi:GDPmannose 4,6-dehydratase
MKAAVVTGITGQDGAYAAKLLLDRGYRVHGAHRHDKAPDLWRLAELGLAGHPGLRLVPFDIADRAACRRLVGQDGVAEVYNFGGQSISLQSTDDPDTAARVNGLGPLNFLNAIRDVNPTVRFCQASSAEMFGAPVTSPQSEDTPFVPRTFYGVAKLHAHRIIETYRADYGLFGCSAILFNHESPLRGTAFITRKITDGLARIKLGLLPVLELGSLDSERDWSFAGDVADAMWRMLQADKADTYVVASGRTISVRRFAELAAVAAGFSIGWRGQGVDETGIDETSGRCIVKVNPAFLRPPETARMCGDAAKARNLLGWKPTKSIEDICRMMVEADLRRYGSRPA